MDVAQAYHAVFPVHRFIAEAAVCLATTCTYFAILRKLATQKVPSTFYRFGPEFQIPAAAICLGAGERDPVD